MATCAQRLATLATAAATDHGSGAPGGVSHGGHVRGVEEGEADAVAVGIAMNNNESLALSSRPWWCASMSSSSAREAKGEAEGASE
jgi:hypothetical protein